MPSGPLVVSPSFPKLQLAIAVSNTTARSPKLASLFVSFLDLSDCRVARLAAVSVVLDVLEKEKVLCSTLKWQRESNSAKLSQTESKWSKDKTTTMKSLDELEHQLNPLSVKEAAMIYGDSPSNFYRRVRRGEIPGVFRKTPKGRIKICPREFVPWLRSQFAPFRGANNGAVQAQSDGNGMASSIQRHEPDRSSSAVNYRSEKNRREGNVA
jgi:hypothetical protein